MLKAGAGSTVRTVHIVHIVRMPDQGLGEIPGGGVEECRGHGGGGMLSLLQPEYQEAVKCQDSRVLP